MNRGARGRAEKALAEAAEAAPGSVDEGASSAAGRSAAAPSEAGEKAHASSEKAHAGGGSSRVRASLMVYAAFFLVLSVPASEATAPVAR